MHTVQLLLDAVTAAVTGLSLTADRVVQSRVYAHANVPALSVRLGERRVLNTLGNSLVDAEQEIFIDIHVAATSEQIDDQLLAIEAEVYAALMLDPQLDLDGIVLDVDPQGLSEPELDVAEKPKAVATSRWRYQLRHSLSSLEG